MEKMSFGDSVISRLERFKEITESTINFDEERARLVLGELEDILNQGKFVLESGLNPNISMSDQIAFREVLELAMILNVRVSNYEEIRKYYKQLNFFYFHDNNLPQSQRMFMLIALSLLVDLYLESSKFKKLNGRQILHSKNNIKKQKNADKSDSAESDDIKQSDPKTDTSNGGQNPDVAKEENKEAGGNSNSSDGDEEGSSEGYLTVDFNDNFFQTNLTEIKIRFQSEKNLYLDFIFNIDKCIENNSIQSLFNIPPKSPSVLFDDMLTQILDDIRRNMSISILSCSDPTNISEFKKLFNFDTIEDARQFLQSLRCRISEDGTVTAPDFLRPNMNHHVESPHAIAFKSMRRSSQSDETSMSRSNSSSFGVTDKNYSDDDQDALYEISKVLYIHEKIIALNK